MANKAKIEKRPDGFYKSSVVIGRDSKGKHKRKYFYAKTIKELNLKKSEFERKLRLGILTDREEATMLEIGQEWLQYKSAFVSDRTYVRYKNVFNKHLKPLHPYRLLDLKATNLQSLLNSMAKKNYSRKTISEVK